MDDYIGALTLDLDCRKNLPKISVGQFDKGRKYLVSITKNSIPFSAQNSTVILQGKRQDKSCFSIACSVNDDGTVTIELNDKILSVSGTAFAKLILSDSSRNYSTQIFAIDVDASFEGNIDDEGNYSLLNDLINRLMLLFELDDPTIPDSIYDAVLEINENTVPESVNWGDRIPASFSGDGYKLALRDAELWALYNKNEDPRTGTINYDWLKLTEETVIDDLEAVIRRKMFFAPLNPPAAQIDAMSAGQLYGDTVNHKGTIKGGQSFYDTTYIDSMVGDIDPALDRSDNIFYFTDTTSRTVNGLTLEFLSKSSVKINGTCTGYQYIGIMGGEGDKKGVVVNSKESYSGTFSLRLVESGGTGAVLRYGAAGATGTAIANNGTVTLNDQYFSLRIIPNNTYTDYIVEVMLTPTEEPEVFHPYKEVLGAVDPVARSRTTADHFLDLCNHVTPQKILTWIDDDTSNTTAIQSVMDIADELGIRCTFASITGNWTTAIVEKLKEAQNEGFHIVSHGHSSHSVWRTEPLLTLDGDLALSLSELRQNGFINSDMIVYPGAVVNRMDIDITQIARKWCRCGVQDYASSGGIYFTGYGKGRYLLNRKFIDKSSHSDAVYYTDILDAFSDDDAPWYLLGTHSSQSDQFDADLIKAVLQHALNTGWTIMTLNEAFNYRERYYRIQEMFGLN